MIQRKLEDVHKDYFQGVLQLRHPSPELVDFVKRTVAESGRARISKTKRIENGIDFYLTDQHYMQNLGKQVKQRFIGDLVVSRRLHTLDKVRSQRVYRITVLFRMFPFKKGDLLEINGEEYKIVLMQNKVLCQSTKSGKKEWLTFEHAQRLMKK